MSDVETVTVAVYIPEQSFKFTYEKYWYDIHKGQGILDHFMDVDISSIDPEYEIYDNDGNRIYL